MTRSMTGFARRECQADWGALTWEVRAVNHRYLDVALRLPEEFRVLEGSLRQLVAKRLGRGKVDCALRFERGADGVRPIELNQALVEQLLQAMSVIGKSMHRSTPADPISVLRWPGVVREPERDPAPMHEAAIELMGLTLEALDEARGGEGARLAQMLLQRCDALAVCVNGVRARLPEVRTRLREKLMKRIEQLDVDVDNDRLEQELALLAQKMDVEEELDRLDSHIQEARDVLERSEPVGRRLDFLMQEFNREANTLASKSQDAETTRLAVDMKVLIEQMREQVQNIE